MQFMFTYVSYYAININILVLCTFIVYINILTFFSVYILIKVLKKNYALEFLLGFVFIKYLFFFIYLFFRSSFKNDFKVNVFYFS